MVRVGAREPGGRLVVSQPAKPDRAPGETRILVHHATATLRWRRAARTLAVALVLLAPQAGTAADPAQPGSGAGHRLTGSASPYLLLHADNPVEWYPWGPEAFTRARAEDKPIFLSVGYSTCFWCHVAERTLYSDPAIAAQMNRWFVNVKVDREQRPDVDRVYMHARQLLSGTGGWPNNVFLTPDREPFFAGSYFPPKRDEHGNAGFPEVLEAIHLAWATRRADVVATARRVQQALRRVGAAGDGNATAAVEPARWTGSALRALLDRFDDFQGGFLEGDRPMKFPRSPTLGLLLARQGTSNEAALARALTESLDAMAYGGIQDHLAGGFHRYSTDPDWSVPHFEKMLYDNAQLLRVYAQAYARFGVPLYRETARRTGRYLATRMRSPEGGFYTAEDAQVDGVEGASYVWTAEEITEALGPDDARRFLDVYALEIVPHSAAALRAAGAPVAEDGGVLRVRRPVSEALERSGHGTVMAMLDALEPARAALLRRRDQRPAPMRDEKLGVDLNGLAIDGFSAAGQALGEPEFVDIARRAAQHVWAAAYDEGTGALAHQVFRGRASGDGFLADYAHLARGLLTLHAVTGEDVWRERAGRLADAMLARFAGADGRLNLAPAAGELPVQLPEEGDLDAPSGTSAAIQVLVDLGSFTGGGRYAEAAARALPHLAAELARYPDAWPALLSALQAPAAGAVIQAARGVKGAASATPGQGGALRTSADFVRVASRVDAAGTRVVITLHVAEGYHVNANPASEDFLIPTQVHFAGTTPVRVVYPPARRFQPSFMDTALAVYEGEVSISADFDSGAAALAAGAAAVTVQACSDTVCYPPSRIPVPGR